MKARKVLLLVVMIALLSAGAASAQVTDHCVTGLTVDPVAVGFANNVISGKITITEPGLALLPVEVSGLGGVNSVGAIFPTGASEGIFRITLPADANQDFAVQVTAHRCFSGVEAGAFAWTDEKTAQVQVLRPAIAMTLSKTEVVGSDTFVDGSEDEIAVSVAARPCVTDCQAHFDVFSFDPAVTAPLRFPLQLSNQVRWQARNSYDYAPTVYPFPLKIRGNLVTHPVLVRLRVTYRFHSASPIYTETFITVMPKEQDKFSIEATVTGTTEVTATKEVKDGNVPVVQVPLGAQVKLRWLKKSENDILGQPVQSTFTLGNAQVADGNLLSPKALFPQSVVLGYGNGMAVTEQSFQAVHRGEVTLTIAPSDGKTKVVQVRVLVMGSSFALGPDAAFDDVVLTLAHSGGVPPQLIKGQVLRESSFDTKAWHYEPIGTDFGAAASVGVSAAPEGMLPLKETMPYSRYTLGKIPAENAPELVEEDVESRSYTNAASTTFALKFRDPLTGEVRSLRAGDPNPTARELITYNPNQNWLSNTSAKVRFLFEEEPTKFEFIAQTPTASSWGLLQILYTTAISTMRWQGRDGSLNPSFLADSPQLTEIRDGSLFLGSEYLLTRYSKANVVQGVPSQEQFTESFVRAYNLYNHSCLGQKISGRIKPDTCSADRYGLDVLQFAARYKPSAILPVLANQ